MFDATKLIVLEEEMKFMMSKSTMLTVVASLAVGCSGQPGESGIDPNVAVVEEALVFPVPTKHYLVGDSIMTGYQSVFQLSGTSYGDLMHTHLTKSVSQGGLGIAASLTDTASNGAGWFTCNNPFGCNLCGSQINSISSTGHALLNVSCLGNDLLPFKSQTDGAKFQDAMFGSGQASNSVVDRMITGVKNALNRCNSTSAFPQGCTFLMAALYDINDMCEVITANPNPNWTADSVAVCTRYGGCPFSTTPVVGQPRFLSGHPARGSMVLDLDAMVGNTLRTYAFTNPKSRAVYLDDHVDTFAGHASKYSSCPVGCGTSWRAAFDFNGVGVTASCATGQNWISPSDSYGIHPAAAGHAALAADGNRLLDELY